MNNPKVSIIVPCYNQAGYLPEALGSVLGQTFADWECIIVNDGSTDETAKVATALTASDSRVRLISQCNRGLSSARNRGLAEARGQFIQFLDADDLLELRKLEQQTCYLVQHPEVGIVYGEARYFTTENPHLRRFGLVGDNLPWRAEESWIGPLWSSGRPLPEILFERNIMAVNCGLVRREVFDQAGYWDERLVALEDWEFWARCAYLGVVFQYVAIPDGLALVRSHPTSMSRDLARMHRAFIRFRTLLGRRLGDPAFKCRNFEIGAHSLSYIPEREQFRQCLALAWANRCWRVLRPFLAFNLRKYPRILRLGRLVRRASASLSFRAESL